MSNNIVAILGCGPAGLLAAHAVTTAGGVPVIISKKQKSVLAGAQYIQRPVPGICDEPDGHIRTYLHGTKDNYARRVYGDASIATSWPEGFDPTPEPAWDIRKAYDTLWDYYQRDIIDSEVSSDDIAELTASFSLTVSTIPAWAICGKKHKFHQMAICTATKAVMPHNEENFVAYNGMDIEDSWYRCARIFGVESTEAIPSKVAPDSLGQNWTLGYKIIGNNCDCHPNLVKTGRLGTWRRGVLTHHAFEHTLGAYQERLAA